MAIPLFLGNVVWASKQTLGHRENQTPEHKDRDSKKKTGQDSDGFTLVSTGPFAV